MSDTKKSGLSLYTSDNLKRLQVAHKDSYVEVVTERKDPIVHLASGNTINHASWVWKSPIGYDYNTIDGIAHLDNDVFASVRSNHAQILANKSTSDFGISSLNADLAQENVARIAGDNTLNAALTAEILRATNKETANESLIVQETTDRVNLGIQVNAKIDSQIAQEITDRESGDATNSSLINAESVRALAAEQGLQNQITNVLSNTDPAALDSLSELLAKMTADNLTLTSLINGLDTRLQLAESTLASHLAD